VKHSSKADRPSYIDSTSDAIRAFTGPDRPTSWIGRLADHHGWDAEETTKAIERELEEVGYHLDVETAQLEAAVEDILNEEI